MKHHLLKSVILSLILVMGVSNAWAKRYYFEVPDIDAWKGKNALYAVRLCKGAGINTGTGWERLTQWDENTYYMDFKSNTYTHFQFCRMKDNITSLEGSSWMNLQHTSCYTMPSPIQTNEDEPNLLVVGKPETYNNSYQSQPYSSNWDYQTFTAENVHIILDVTANFWRFKPADVELDYPPEYTPLLLIGDNESSMTIPMPKIENSFTIYHCYIERQIEYTGYTFIQPAEAEATNDNTPFHERCAEIDRIINKYHEETVDPNTGKTFQEIISNKHEDESTYATIVNRTKQRTKSYFEPITGNALPGNVLHNYRPGDFVDSKTYFDNISDLNKNLTIEVKVSYDGGKTYTQTGTLPLRLYTIDGKGYQPKTWSFHQDWDRMDQSTQLDLKYGGKTFSYKTKMGYRASNILMNYEALEADKYEIVEWIMNNQSSKDDPKNGKKYQPQFFEEENPVITLYIKKINDWKCTVTFNTAQLSNIPINSLEVEPNTKIAAPIIDKELQPVGMVCKWYTHPTFRTKEYEFDFDTHITQDYTLYGAWVPEAEEGDYRLLYVEQVVEKSTQKEGDEWKTVITRKKAHPSDIIKKRAESGVDTVSLHVYNNNTYQAVKNPKATNNEDKYYDSPSNSEVILQRYNGTTWEDKEHHMVFGPMETLPTMAMLPGRRNAEGNATLKYDEGIPVIQEDTKYDGNGVWNFPIVQSGNGDATLDRENIERYEGTYYIRTANAEGGWNNYTIPANHMTFSEYQASLGLGNEEFTHYFCKWVDLDKLDSKFVHYVVANDYAQAVSDTLIADRTDLFGKPLEADQQIVGNDAVLPTSANIRFSWREENNALHRAYIGSSDFSDYLVVHDASGDMGHKLYSFTDQNGLTDNKQTFNDNAHWMYQADVYAQTHAPIKLTANYPSTNSKTQYFKGTESEKTVPLIGGNVEDDTKYPIRILYDFKENHLITGYVPQEEETKDVAINTNLMMIRKNHGAANQLTMNLSNDDTDGVAVNTGYDAYGVLTFTESHLSTDNWKVTNDKTFYWISFPFDVNLKDAFGFGKYAYHWYIEYYDGAARAENGLFLDSGTYWEYVMEEDADNFVLHANQGYVLWLNVAQIQADGFFTAITKEISIYFPAAKKIANNFQTRSETINLPAQRRPEGSRREVQDSNWRLIGVPSYANTKATTSQSDINFVYIYDAKTNKYNVAQSASQIGLFQSMHAYMVQYEGNITWTTVVNEYPSLLAARQSSNSTKEQHVLRLELLRNGSKEDHTYIQLQDDKATEMFDMNLDLTKMSGSGGNIYSIIPSSSDPIQVAANVMPIEECIIPLGIKTTKATNYTFAMPDGTDGIVVDLIDYETNTRTNMLLDNYTVNLGKGTFDNRFALHVKPDKTTTSLEDVNTNTTGVKKYLIDGALYMQKDSALYDAQGKLVR